jgi:transposase InsO family protein
LQRKSDVKPTFICFKAIVENYFKHKIITFYSDNGGEFTALKDFFQIHGISHHTSPPHTPEHNGISELKHRHIVETSISLLTHASLPQKF